ncbi:expressed unknown protein [Seminavis robusta]|uniref:O-fucosyltransferase family protein n=1 Tax=Seminavis robusta TaxID=568900 RepID=A0A9N8E6F7_9STRA|nr:expressed unknown protein [Seminavis robusta]|eukprot:Sro671_g184920.1 n/a (466) ;mRNA; r:36399-37796
MSIPVQTASSDEEKLPLTVKDEAQQQPKAISPSMGICTTRYLILVVLNVMLALFVLYVNLASTGPCGDSIAEIKTAVVDHNSEATVEVKTAVLEESSVAAPSTTTSTPPVVDIEDAEKTPVNEPVSSPAPKPPPPKIQVNYVDYILSRKMTNICLVQGSGLCSNIMNIMGQKILFTDKGRGFIVDDTRYNYKWKDGSTGVLRGFFTPQFPVLGEGEWDHVIRPRFHTNIMDVVVGVGMTGLYRDRDQKMEVQWCPGERYRGFFPPVYGTTGEELYNRFVKEACDSFLFNDVAKQEIKAVRDQHNIPDLRQSNSVAFHVRRGDKLIGESALFPGSVYVSKLLEVITATTNPKIDDCFIASDDFAAVAEIIESLEKHRIPCKIHSLTNKEEHGSDFRYQRNGPTDFESTIEFLTEMSLMVDATYFIGTFNSNVGSVASIIRKCHYPEAPHYANSYGVDQDEWYYRLH